MPSNVVKYNEPSVWLDDGDYFFSEVWQYVESVSQNRTKIINLKVSDRYESLLNYEIFSSTHSPFCFSYSCFNILEHNIDW
jgi:hypothetical protein